MKNSLIKVISSLQVLSNKNKNNKLRYYYNDNIYKSSFLYMNNAVNNKDLKNSPYKDILLNYMMKSEKVMPGGSELFINLLSDTLFNFEINTDFKRKCTFNDIVKMSNDFVLEEKTRKIILNTIKFAGPEGNIHCTPTQNNELNIVKNNNPKINNIHLVNDFINVYFSNKKEITSNFLVLCLDAFLERESEIMSAIDFAHENKKSLIVFARGYSTTFIKNIKSILLRNNLKVFLYNVKYDNNDPFLLKDISMLTKAEIISAEKGHSFYGDLSKYMSDIDLKVSINSIEFTKEISPQTIKKINSTLNIKDNSDTSLKEYINKRKKRLIPNTVNVYIPKTQVRIIQDFKSLIYFYNNTAISGFITYKSKRYPARCFNYIKLLVENADSTINNLGFVIKEKNKND